MCVYEKLVNKNVKIVVNDDGNTKVFKGIIFDYDKVLNKFLMFNEVKQQQVLINISNIVTLEVQNE